MPEMLTLNDGTELENSQALENNSTLFVYIRNGFGLKEVFDLLIEPEKTKKILFTQINGEHVIFRGYKRLIDVRDEENGAITAVLKK